MPDAAESLENAIGFSAVDLAANRGGRVSAAQRAMFGQWDERLRGYDELNHRLALIAGPALLVGALVSCGVAFARGFSPLAPLADKDLMTLVCFSGAMAFFGSISLAWGASRARIPPLRYPEYVHSVEGYVLFNEQIERGWGTDAPNFDIEGIHFTVSNEVARGFSHASRYRLYYVVLHIGSPTLLSAEPAPNP